MGWVSPHRTLNSKKGIIYCPDLKECSDEEILDELGSQDVTNLQRIHITRTGKRTATGTFIVTFNSPVITKCHQRWLLNNQSSSLNT